MSEPTLSVAQQRALHAIFERGAESASQALSRWLGRTVQLEVAEVEQTEIEQAIEAVGPGDALIAACCMGLTGRVSGELLLIFEDRAGLALADMLLNQPPGTSTVWGDLERSAAQETANIVGCAYLNALASHLPGISEPLVPGPPEFRHEFAASLLEFALLDQAIQSDRVLLVRTRFEADSAALDWSLVFVPSSATHDELLEQIGP